jgi:hypothetical protein
LHIPPSKCHRSSEIGIYLLLLTQSTLLYPLALKIAHELSYVQRKDALSCAVLEAPVIARSAVYVGMLIIALPRAVFCVPQALNYLIVHVAHPAQADTHPVSQSDPDFLRRASQSLPFMLHKLISFDSCFVMSFKYVDLRSSSLTGTRRQHQLV